MSLTATLLVQTLLAMAVLTASNASAAQSLEILLGKEREVCRVYKRSLGSGRVKMQGPDCARKIKPGFPHLSKPRWNELDLEQNELLVERIADFFGDTAALESGLEQILHQDILSVRQTQVDIDNDAHIDTVIKYRKGRCGETSLYAAPIVVLSATRTEVEQSKTSSLLQNERQDASFVGRWHYGMYDIFSYRRRTYFDVWSGYDKDRLSVYEIVKGEALKVCHYLIHSRD